METMERKKPRPRRSFTPEFKAEIVEAANPVIARRPGGPGLRPDRDGGRSGSPAEIDAGERPA